MHNTKHPWALVLCLLTAAAGCGSVSAEPPAAVPSAPDSSTTAPVPSSAAVTPAADDRHVHEFAGVDHHHHPHRHSVGEAAPEDGHHHRSSGHSVHGDVHDHPSADPADAPHGHPHTHMDAQELGAVFLKQMDFPSDPPTYTTTAQGR